MTIKVTHHEYIAEIKLSAADLLEAANQYWLGIPLLILFGLAFGSFATMASYRLPRGEDLVFKPSFCPSCQHVLSVWDLFPIFSWLFSKGKCRYCKTKIHIRYPLTELVMAILFVLVYCKTGISLVSLALLGLSVCLVIMTVTDIEHRIIPDSLQIAILLCGILYRYALDSEIYQYFSGLFFGLGFALALRYGFFLWKKREGLGMGDVKFFAVSGMFLGIKSFIPFLFFAGIFGIIFSLIWRKLGGEEEFPFGPALGASMLLCLLFPEYSVNLLYYYQ